MRFFVIAALLNGCGALLLNHNVPDNASVFVEFDDQLQMPTLVEGLDCLGGWNAINPSFVSLPDTREMAVAFRGLCLHKFDAHASWYSRMVVGKIPAADIRAGDRTMFHWKSLTLAPDLRRLGPTRHECQLSDLDIARGPEDPRFVRTQAGLYAVVTAYDVVPAQEGILNPECDAHGMLLYTAKVETLDPPAFGPPVQLTFEGMSRVEKNWAMFAPPSLAGAEVLAVYSVSPHTIAKVNLQSGNVTFIADSHSRALDSLAHQLGTEAFNFHGGAGVAHWIGSHHSFFLSVLHTSVRQTDGTTEYWNYPYKFSDEPPYEIIRIGKKLPLQVKRNPAYGEYVAFVTTIMMDEDSIFIGYGSGDTSSRTFRMDRAEFDHAFFPSADYVGQDVGVVDVAEEVDAEDLAKLKAVMALNATSQCASLGCLNSLSPSVCRACHNVA